MAWVAVNKNGSEKIFDFEPERYEEIWVPRAYTNGVYIPKGTIKKLINKELNWEDNPIELKNF